MKKITFLMFLFIGAAFMQAQNNLVTNGDFETGMLDPWFGNAGNVRTEGDNSFNFANVETMPENVFDVNLSQVLSITQGQTYTLSFDASSDGPRSLVAGIGLNEAPFTAATETVNLTTETQTFTLTLSSADFGSDNSRVLFDLGGDTGVVVLDNVVLINSTANETGEELVVNGDFEAETIDPWFGNAANKQTEGDNSFNFANVETMPENVFDVNLSQVLTIVQGQTYTLMFDASSDGNRTLVAGIGLNEAPFTAATEVVNLTDQTQTFTLTLSSAEFGNANSRVLFDLGGDTGVVVIDNVSLKSTSGGNDGGGDPVTEPTMAAPTPPARNAQDYFSVYSDAYTDQPDVVFGAFDVGTQDFQMVEINGDMAIKANFNQPQAQFLFADWGTTVDNSDMTNFHFDYWTDTNLRTGLIANPKFSNHVGNNGETSAFELNNPVNTFGEWVSVDVPISTMTSIGADNQRRDALRQFILTVAGADNGSRTVYLDNIYLYKEATASTQTLEALDVKVYPNPSVDQWTVNTGGDMIQSIELFDLAGKQFISVTPNSTTYRINASNLSSGFYMAKITTSKGQGSIKLIKQ